jgi:hypothetical protein
MIRWETLRADWLRPKGSAIKSKRVHLKEINADDIVEKIFSTNGGWELDCPVPLNQMVDILIDFWQSEGLYD